MVMEAAIIVPEPIVLITAQHTVPKPAVPSIAGHIERRTQAEPGTIYHDKLYK